MNHPKNNNRALGYLILAHAFDVIGDFERAFEACNKGLSQKRIEQGVRSTLLKRRGSVSRAQRRKAGLNGSERLVNSM